MINSLIFKQKYINFNLCVLFLYFFPIIFIEKITICSADPSHAIAMHGEPKLPKDFKYFPYVNPNAPKDGTIHYAWTGTFDSINPFIVQGNAARGSIDGTFGNLVFDTLMTRAADEPFTLYPLIAKAIETNDARDYVEFTFDERARFSDGEPIKPEDLIFTIELLRDKGFPRYATLAYKIKTIEKNGDQKVKITFKNPDRELPLIFAGMVVLPKHAINPETFDKSTLKPFIGSGAYTIEKVRPGESIIFTRNPDYWAQDIPSMRGIHNYKKIKITYYRDENSMFEAFRKGLVDVFFESNMNRWKSDYDFPAIKRGEIIKESFKKNMPESMYGIVLNTRKKIFQNQKLRHALTHSFDFEWVNRKLLGSGSQRTTSFFGNSDLSSSGHAASAQEKSLLASFPNLVSESIMREGWKPRTSDGSGYDRCFFESALKDLKEAGYSLKNGKSVEEKLNQPLKFEIILHSGGQGEKIALAWKQTLEKIGIDLTVSSVDSVQFQNRLTHYDYDCFIMRYPSSLTPGIEQIGRWGSSIRDKPGTFNFSGASHPAIDSMITMMINAKTRTELIDIVRAYDRILLSQDYIIPLYHNPEIWIPHQSKIKRPQKTPLRGPQLVTWWYEN